MDQSFYFFEINMLSITFTFEMLQFKDDVSCSQQNVNPNEATAEDNRKRITKRKDAEEAATTTR